MSYAALLQRRWLDRFRAELRADLAAELHELVAEELAALRMEVAELDRRLTSTHQAALRVATDNLTRR